jgi:hypothetical protein
MLLDNGCSWERMLIGQFTCIRAWKSTGLTSSSIHQAAETISVITVVTFLEEIVTGDSWFETRSQICSTGRQVNVCSDELVINLLELRAKRTLASITYIGAHCGMRTSRLLTHRESSCCCFYDSICREERYGLPVAVG